MRTDKLAPIALLLFTSSLVGCAPPKAPTELQQLACFLFEHAQDEDPTLLAEGLVNLDAWFAAGHQEDAEEGFQINMLTENAISDLNGKDFTLSEELVGAAIATEYDADFNDVIATTAVDDWHEINEGIYEYYDKTWVDGGDCIGDNSCATSEASSESELVVLGVSIVSKNYIQYRWVETELGWAFVHRSWLVEPPEVSSDLVEPNSQFYLAVTLPGGSPLRLQATWIDTKIVGLNVPKSQVVGTLRDQAEAVEVWLDEKY